MHELKEEEILRLEKVVEKSPQKEKGDYIAAIP